MYTYKYIRYTRLTQNTNTNYGYTIPKIIWHLIFQEIKNRLEFMCEILHVYVHHHMYTDYFAITEDLDVLNTSEIDELCESPIAYNDINGVIYDLTLEVCIMLSKFK